MDGNKLVVLLVDVVDVVVCWLREVQNDFQLTLTDRTKEEKNSTLFTCNYKSKDSTLVRNRWALNCSENKVDPKIGRAHV